MKTKVNVLKSLSNVATEIINKDISLYDDPNNQEIVKELDLLFKNLKEMRGNLLELYMITKFKCSHRAHNVIIIGLDAIKTFFDENDNPTKDFSRAYEQESALSDLEDKFEYALSKDFGSKVEVKSMLKDIIYKNYDYINTDNIEAFDNVKDDKISDERFLDLLRKNMYFEVIE